ncbi:MAG TPA: NAD(P)/FAD-dependent oxidoreductase [Daejeonella sp.]|nr:NAD(P)/FAD-dependent oxidoreductase [Daejeonella sp.]
MTLRPGKKDLSIGIIGAGLAGLTAAILLGRQGYNVTVIEKKEFPFHRVCGEYVSNEVLPFLQSLKINISQFNPSDISKLTISSTSGKLVDIPLQMGGFGISRYVFDNHLYQAAKALGVDFVFAKANNITFENELFSIDLSSGAALHCDLAIAAYGKRANLDQKLKRTFFYQRSPYMGVKYHIKTNLPPDLIRLDNFEGGYCGTCKIEDDLYNLCYLTKTENLKGNTSIAEMERTVLFKNPHLKQIFNNSDFVWDKPEVINEISFERKTLVEDHILFCGDAAGMITPLCGNGMAMAIHSGKLLAECIIRNGKHIDQASRLTLERNYKNRWEDQFATRLKAGRYIQKLLLHPQLSNFAINLLKSSNRVAKLVVKSTHGKSFNF